MTAHGSPICGRCPACWRPRERPALRSRAGGGGSADAARPAAAHPRGAPGADRRERAHHRGGRGRRRRGRGRRLVRARRNACEPTSQPSPTRGILLRDPETGLVDFPAERDGERVFLCWRLGEDRVAFFHERARRLHEAEAAGERRRAPGRSWCSAPRLTTRHPASRPPRPSPSCGTRPISTRRPPCWREADGGLLRGAPTELGCRPPGQHATRVRWIQSASAGVDSLLFPELIESDVDVTNARGVFDEPIAEWVIGGHARVRDRIARFDRSTSSGASGRRVVRPSGSTGRGSWWSVPARSAAPPAHGPLALGMSVALVGREPRRHETFGDVLGVDRLHEALADADHVLDALPLTDATRGLFDAAAFAAMRPRARFFNVGRGATVDEHGLDRGAARPGTSPARRSTCSRRSRCRPRARCGRCRT